MNFDQLNIDNNWTLFLDRDGVINERLIDDYVKHPTSFKFMAGVKKAMCYLSARFGRIIIVTNQQGIGKGLMTLDDVHNVHRFMIRELEKEGARVDKIYVAHQREAEAGEMRKPSIGMAKLAKEEFSEINFCKSLMVGDAVSDIQFGKRAGMKTVFIGEHYPKEFVETANPDFVFPSLYEMVLSLIKSEQKK
jgi:histidinol-phosphate phosphatase family protein